MSGLALSTYVNPWIACAMLISFLLLSIETYLATYTIGTFRLSFARFGPTELRILLALANATLWFSPNAALPAFHLRLLDFVSPNAALPGFHLRLLDFGGLIGSCAMFLMAIVSAILHTRELYLKEPLH
jgi:archaetidylinositol phosphate synthase